MLFPKIGIVIFSPNLKSKVRPNAFRICVRAVWLQGLFEGRGGYLSVVPVLKLTFSLPSCVLFKPPPRNPQQHHPENPPFFSHFSHIFPTSYSIQLVSSLGCLEYAFPQWHKWNMHPVAFCGRLLSFSTVPLRTVHQLRPLRVAEVSSVASISQCLYTSSLSSSLGFILGHDSQFVLFLQKVMYINHGKILKQKQKKNVSSKYNLSICFF